MEAEVSRARFAHFIWFSLQNPEYTRGTIRKSRSSRLSLKLTAGLSDIIEAMTESRE